MVSTANRRAPRGGPSATAPEPPRAGHPRLRKAFLVVAAVLSLALIGGSAVAISGIHYAERQIQSLPTGPCSGENGCLHHVLPCSKDVCNFLILGSDSRTGLTKTEQSQYGNASQVTGQRSDTIILVHEDFARNRTIVVSIPRDLYVTIPGHGQGKINSAFDYGPNVTVQTVSRLFGM